MHAGCIAMTSALYHFVSAKAYQGRGKSRWCSVLDASES